MVTDERRSFASWKQWPVRVCFGLLFSFVAQSAAAQIRTVLVSPVPGNPVASGTALRNALAGISAPSSTNRWLLKIEPGIYDVGAVSLAMRSWVDIEGSGIGTTTIRGAVPFTEGFAGTIHGASEAELRLLTVEAIGSGAVPSVIAMHNESAFPRLYRVKLATSGGAAGWGMRNAQSAPRIEECEISASATGAGSIAYGIVFRGYVSGGQRSSILRSKITVSGAASNYGVYLADGQTLTELRNSRIDANGAGGSTTYGIYAIKFDFWTGAEGLTLRDAEVLSGGGTSASYGVYLDANTSVYLDATDSRIWGQAAPTTYGIYQAGNMPVALQASNVVGSTHTVRSILSSVAIVSTQLVGGPVIAGGWFGCMGVSDENGIFYANSCP